MLAVLWQNYLAPVPNPIKFPLTFQKRMHIKLGIKWNENINFTSLMELIKIQVHMLINRKSIKKCIPLLIMLTPQFPRWKANPSYKAPMKRRKEINEWLCSVFSRLPPSQPFNSFLKLIDVIISTISLVDMELACLGNSLPQMEIHCIS